ncbi:MAG: DUF1612 domain-containing protein, partial [Gemmataceae bacterium]|nr:DUF1612 domain-containing protein [Gemmataceae bacterium]
PFPVLRRPVKLRGVLKETPAALAPEIDIELREKWRRVLRASQQLTPVLAAAIVWDCWMHLVPEAASGWRATLLAALVLRAMGTTPREVMRLFSLVPLLSMSPSNSCRWPSCRTFTL